jgi:hypothetical protein
MRRINASDTPYCAYVLFWFSVNDLSLLQPVIIARRPLATHALQDEIQITRHLRLVSQ